MNIYSKQKRSEGFFNVFFSRLTLGDNPKKTFPSEGLPGPSESGSPQAPTSLQKYSIFPYNISPKLAKVSPDTTDTESNKKCNLQAGWHGKTNPKTTVKKH